MFLFYYYFHLVLREQFGRTRRLLLGLIFVIEGNLEYSSRDNCKTKYIGSQTIVVLKHHSARKMHNITEDKYRITLLGPTIIPQCCKFFTRNILACRFVTVRLPCNISVSVMVLTCTRLVDWN